MSTPQRVTELMVFARAFRNGHILGTVIVIWAASRPDWGILRAEPFMPGTRPTSTCSSEGYGLLSNTVGHVCSRLLWARLVAFAKFALARSISGMPMQAISQHRHAKEERSR